MITPECLKILFFFLSAVQLSKIVFPDSYLVIQLDGITDMCPQSKRRDELCETCY